MKKFLLLAGIVALCSSCLKNDYYKESLTSTGYNIYLAAYRQSILALDPFNIAFRLNTLIVEGKGDPNATTLTLRNEVLAPGAQITYTESTGLYTIVYSGAPATGDAARRDFTHKGSIRIFTNGYATLSEASAKWTVEILSGYTLYSNADAIGIKANVYTIENQETNSWSVSMQNFVSNISTASSSGSTNYASDWTGVYEIKQETGTQNVADVVKSIFTVNTHIRGSKTMYYPADAMTVATPTPYQYNPQCSNRVPVGNGKMTISLMEDTALQNYTEAQLLGTDTKTCNPKTRITYSGNSTDYSIQ